MAEATARFLPAQRSNRQLLPRREETLEMMRSEAHRTTGHAFIVFLYERDRNQLIRKCRANWLQRRLRSAMTGSTYAVPASMMHATNSSGSDGKPASCSGGDGGTACRGA